MAGGARPLDAMTELPEERLASKIINKYKLAPPIDVESIIKNFAKLEYRDIPISGIDGVSIGIKIPGQVPIVVVKETAPKTRQQFTLAHELAHLVIPWHIGTVIGDSIDDSIYSKADYMYREMEQEANRFAASLLMPREWVQSMSKLKSDLSELHNGLVTGCQVSPIAAAIRMTSVLSPGIVYILEADSMILSSGRTNGTFQPLPPNEIPIWLFQSSTFAAYSVSQFGNKTFHWWRYLPGVQLQENEDPRSWRELLDFITEELQPAEGAHKFKASVNAIIANANGDLKRNSSHYNTGALMAACIQRLSRSSLNALVNHKDFHTFLSKKVRDLFKS